MSRIDYADCDDNADFLRACAFSANTEKHLKGEKGQKALKELEAALLELPEKKLIRSRFMVKENEKDEVGAVCALGALALKRRLDKGMTRAQAVQELDLTGPSEDEYSKWQELKNTADFLKLKMNFVWEVVEKNDEDCGPTWKPEDRYKHVLEWVQKRITR